MRLQLRRRCWLFVHDILVHPICGVLKILGIVNFADWLHEITLPPLRAHDREYHPTPEEPEKFVGGDYTFRTPEDLDN